MKTSLWKKSPMPVILAVMSGVFVFSSFLFGQPARKDSAFYAEKTIWGEKKTVLTMDFSGIPRPASAEECRPLFHLPPVRQDTTSTCWAFSGVSFLESELYRLHGLKVRLSVMYVVYWEYVEKARRFVREKGNSEFGEGSEHEAVLLRMKQYGIVRDSDYSGLLNGKTVHHHGPLFKEMRKYLDYVKENALWDEDIVLANIRMILDKHLGKPPDFITVDGGRMTPAEYLERKLRLPLDAYVSVMSCLSVPFYTRGEFKVPDNWWHSREYVNVPLGDWYSAIKRAITAGYSLAIGGDVSEAGKSREQGIAVVPGFDLPQASIDQDSREFRIENGTTGDDHGIHLIGSAAAGGHDWFLIKDSGSSAYAGPYNGYVFYRDDFVRLKMLTYTVHRDAVKELMQKCR
jgi:bleomycin hydrolase